MSYDCPGSKGVALSNLIRAADPEAASRLEKAILEPTGSKMVAKAGSGGEEGVTAGTVTP
jgi:hypothetical protein